MNDDALAPPDVIELLANQRRAELAKQTEPQSSAMNVAYDGYDDDVLISPITNWEEEAKRQSQAERHRGFM